MAGDSGIQREIEGDGGRCLLRAHGRYLARLRPLCDRNGLLAWLGLGLGLGLGLRLGLGLVTVFWPMRIVEEPSALGTGARTAPPYRLPSCSAIALSVTWEMAGDGVGDHCRW